MCGFEVLEARGENCLNQDFQDERMNRMKGGASSYYLRKLGVRCFLHGKRERQDGGMGFSGAG